MQTFFTGSVIFLAQAMQVEIAKGSMMFMKHFYSVKGQDTVIVIGKLLKTRIITNNMVLTKYGFHKRRFGLFSLHV